MATSFEKRRDTLAAVREAVEDFFKQDEAKYQPFNERNVASATYAVHAKIGKATVFFHAYKDKLIVKLMLPIKAEESDRANVGEYLHRANYGLMIGNFDFDFTDGEISYRVPIYCGKDDFAPPTYEQIDFAVLIGLAMISKYGDGLLKVILGVATPEEAVDAAEADDD